MSELNNHEYYRARAEKARALADAAASDKIRAIHLEMVQHYVQLVHSTGPGTQPVRLVQPN